MARLSPSIRRYRPADARAVVAAMKTNIPAAFDASELPWFRAYLKGGDGNADFVLSVEGRIVGFGGYAIDRYVNRATLCWGLIAKPFQARGLGRALLEHRLAHLAGKSPSTRYVAINTTPVSAGFFERCGFRAYATWPRGYRSGLDMVEMMLDLHARAHHPRTRRRFTAPSPAPAAA